MVALTRQISSCSAIIILVVSLLDTRVVATLESLFCSNSETDPLPCDLMWSAKYAYAREILLTTEKIGQCANSSVNYAAYREKCELGVAAIESHKAASFPELFTLPVMAVNDQIYANLFCALCNDQRMWHILPFPPTCEAELFANKTFTKEIDANVTEVDLEILYNKLLRHCQVLEVYLSNYLFPATYGSEACVAQTKAVYGGRKSTFEPDEIFRIRILDYFDSFSIILNFGFNGQSSVEVETESSVKKCKLDEVYDPISGMCKQVYCPLGSKSSWCQQLNIEDEVEDTAAHSTDGLCLISMEMSMPQKLYTWLESLVFNLDEYMAELLGIDKRDVVVEVFITQKTYSGRCTSNRPMRPFLGRPKKCWVHVHATFMAVIPGFPKIDEVCHLITLIGRGDLTFSLANRTMQVNGKVIPLPNLNVNPSVINATHHNVSSMYNVTIPQNVTASIPYNGTDGNFTLNHDAGLRNATVVQINNEYCYKLHSNSYPDTGQSQSRSMMSVYSYRTPRFFMLTRTNFEYVTKNLSYSRKINGSMVYYEQNEHLLRLAETRRIYKEGEFEFVMQVSFPRSQTMATCRETIGYAIVCEYRLANCSRIGYHPALVTWGPNKSLIVNGATYVRKDYVWLDFDEIAICVDRGQYNLNERRVPGICDEKSYSYMFYWSTLTFVSYELNMLSIACSTAVLVTYLVISELHNFPGFNMINLSIASIMSKLVFTHGSADFVAENRYGCFISAALLHYFLLTELMWMSVVAHHAFVVFVKHRLRVVRVQMSRFIGYFLFAWGLPAIWVTCCVLIDRIPEINEALGFRFYYGDVSPYSATNRGGPATCWINDYSMAFYIFGIPLLAIVTVNCSLFVITCLSISQVAKHRRFSRLSLSLSHSCQSEGSITSHSNASTFSTRDVQIFARLSLITGVAWITAVVFIAIEGLSSATVQDNDVVLCSVLCTAEISFVVAQGSLGILQFYAYIWSRRIYVLYMALFRRIAYKVSFNLGIGKFDVPRDGSNSSVRPLNTAASRSNTLLWQCSRNSRSRASIITPIDDLFNDLQSNPIDEEEAACNPELCATDEEIADFHYRSSVRRSSSLSIASVAKPDLISRRCSRGISV